MKRRLITYNDYESLSELLNSADATSKKSGYVDKLSRELLSATMYPQDLISDTVVIMNSVVRVKELSNGKEIDISLTYPYESINDVTKISILSPIGFALLGRMIGDHVSWPTPDGIGQFEIMEVTYQPEVVGGHNLL